MPATITATFAQCGLVVHTYHHESCRTSVPKSWLTCLLCFIGLDCVAQKSFVLSSQCAVLWRTSHHHERVARSKKLGITWRLVSSFLLCKKKKAPVIISAFFALYGPVTNTLPFLESRLLRVMVRFFLFVTGS